jgi:deoxyribonuclease-1
MKAVFIAASLLAIALLGANATAAGYWYAVSLSDSVLSFGAVTTGETDSLVLTLTNNTAATVEVTRACFEEDVFWASVPDPDIAAMNSADIVIYFNSEQNVDYTDFLRIDLDGGIRPLIVEVSAEAHYADTYYASTQDKWGEDLKAALTAIIDDHNSVGYNTARDSMYGHIDNHDGWVECVYTGRQAYFSTRAGATANGFNCEHTWPQSFSGEAEPMKSDIFHLYPTDETANNKRANLDFGIVTSATWSQGGSKLGTDSQGQTVFEPRDAHKGNVARTHFYYIIRYSGNYNLYQNPSKMEAHFRNWHISDPVDSAEIQRNEDIFNIQGNRNPFIDHPELVDRISSFFGTATVDVGPEIAVAPALLDLGEAGFDTTVTGYIAIVNTGNDTLSVSSITSTNPDFVVNTACLELPPEAYTYVGISYTSGDVEIDDSTTIAISSDDSDEGLLEVPARVEIGNWSGLDEGATASSAFRLYQNSPNPFTGETVIAFELDRAADVTIRLFNVRGQIVTEVLAGRPMSAGRHRVVISAHGLSPGVYYCRLAADGRTLTNRLVLTDPS